MVCALGARTDGNIININLHGGSVFIEGGAVGVDKRIGAFSPWHRTRLASSEGDQFGLDLAETWFSCGPTKG